MIEIDLEKCIGCGSCVRDCLPRALEIANQKARFLPDHNCMACGHCIAICPRDAVTLLGADEREVVELRELNHELDPETFMGHLRARRSIRSFKPTPVEREQIEKLLEAGRFSPTGGNRQNVVYHVFQDKVGELRSLVIGELKEMGLADIASGNRASWYSDFWVQIASEYETDGKDSLFFDAPVVIAVSSDVPQAATIAAAHMETMAYALGLGVLYSGFTVRAISHSKALQDYLRLQDGYQVWCVLVLGHPAVKYLRTVPRNPAQVIWD